MPFLSIKVTSESVLISPASFLLLIIHVFSLLFIFVIFVSHLPLGVKDLPANSGNEEDMGSIPQSGRSPGVEWQPALLFLPGKFRGQRSPVGYSLWSHRVRHDWATEHWALSFLLELVNFINLFYEINFISSIKK